MKHYEIREAAKILDLTEDRIRSCVRAGILRPRRGPRRNLQLSFQDLLLLRTTKGLLESGVPARRISRLMGSLKRQLPDDAHLSSIAIYADGPRLVVWDGDARWEPDSGQFLFNFDVRSISEVAVPDIGREAARARAEDNATAVSDAVYEFEAERQTAAVLALQSGAPDAGVVALEPVTGPGAIRSTAGHLALVESPNRPPRRRSTSVAIAAPIERETQGDLTARQWFELALELEVDSREEARNAYHRALELDSGLADAHVNLGRLYHETEDLDQAEAHYLAGTEHAPEDPVVWFNLGVLHEDRQRPHQAIACYKRALERDPEYTDAHQNLGLVLDALGRRAEAMTHLMAARDRS